jgi:hypothetical protein
MSSKELIITLYWKDKIWILKLILYSKQPKIYVYYKKGDFCIFWCKFFLK